MQHDIGKQESAGGAVRRSLVSSSYRNVLAIVAGLTVLQAAMAVCAILVTLNLRAAGVSNLMLGVIASSFATGFLIGTRISPSEIHRIGHIRAYALFAAIATISALSFITGINPIIWLFIQFILGVACSGLLTAGESWVSDASPETERGAILAFYHMISKSGAILGPFLISGLTIGYVGFVVAAVLFTASLIPITTTERAQPSLATASPFGVRQIFKLAPAAGFAAFVAGAVNNAVAQLYPVFAAATAFADGPEIAAKFNAAVLCGAMLSLWPAGLISDRSDRRLIIAILGLLGAVSALGLIVSLRSSNEMAVYISAFFFGAGSLSYYAVAVAHAADRSTREQVTSMMAGMLMIWGIGSICGPLLAGVAMSVAQSPSGLFYFAGFALSLLTVSMFSRAARTDAVAADDKEPFGVAPATTYAIAELDPRGDSAQFDLFDFEMEDAPK